MIDETVMIDENRLPDDPAEIADQDVIEDDGLSDRERRRRELEASFREDDYDVVRKEMFSHLRDPALTVRPRSISFNQACIDELQEVLYVTLRINENLHRLLIEPCDKDTPHALRWCTESKGKRKSRELTGVPFCEQLYKLMEWSVKIRYKVLGYKIRIDDHFAFVFLLDVPEKFDIAPKKKKGDSSEPRKRTTAKGYYSDDVLQNMGIPIEQYRRDTAVINQNGFVQIGMLTGGNAIPIEASTVSGGEV